MGSDVDERFMRLAIAQAEFAVAAGEVPVGCVFVRDEVVIGEGFNATNEECNATRHAELVAIDSILDNFGSEIFETCDLYVTCEPCIMCAAALGRIAVRRVIFGCHNEKFGGCGSILSLHDGVYPISAGVLKEEAVSLFHRFYSRENTSAPEAKRKRKTPR